MSMFAWRHSAKESRHRGDVTLNTTRICGLDDQHDRYAYPLITWDCINDQRR